MTRSSTDAPTQGHSLDSGTALDWGLMARQWLGVLRFELRYQLLSRRALILYFLAAMPIVLVFVWALSPLPGRTLEGPLAAAPVFAFIFTGYLGTSIFLSCLILFMSLFRSEILQRSLHYYFLTPVRREVIVVGKYSSALLASAGVFATATAVLYLIFMAPWGMSELSRYMFQGPGLSHLLTYVTIAMVGCLAYGALFLLIGLMFKNPIVPVLVFYAWENVNFMLPSTLKKMSVLFYLWSLMPIQLSDGPFAVVAEPVPAYVSVPGMLLFAVVVLAVASWRARTYQVTYGGED